MEPGLAACPFVVSSLVRVIPGFETKWLYCLDQSVKILGLTSASKALHNYPPQLSVDGNFRTCFFSNRLNPRCWRVELYKQSMQIQSIISVALILPPISM